MLLSLCLAVTPARFRKIREEQWQADLRDGPAMGFTTSSLLYAVVRSSATARFHDTLHRGRALLSRLTNGGNMKMLFGIAGTAAILVTGTALGLQMVHSQEDAPVARTPVNERPIAGYEGWWNSTPVSGNTTGLPQETVTVNTRTGQVVDAFNRAKNSTLISDVNYTPVPDATWPANSVIIIDTASGQIIEDFLVDERGVPLDEMGRPYGSAAG
ncbi:hypothetical protein [Pseudarthrobacter sp. efr-133-R2A-89]|uniref:hypothetical protein n=1 Tax=Pseudarthrobacter sp. efr-133-R2A-89 TaxID=3040302 RepID=UPI00255675CD|nr:hypothetical protein [Pseudarthrobacter sp. efr-133-R2A-89]